MPSSITIEIISTTNVIPMVDDNSLYQKKKEKGEKRIKTPRSQT